MATFRKRGSRWQVQVRRKDHTPLSRSFAQKADAEKWARSAELALDRTHLPSDPRILKTITLGQLVQRYSDSVSIRKKRCNIEQMELKAFLRYSICSKKLSELRTADFAEYRDIRLKQIKPASLKRSLTPIRHLFEVARQEWGLPIISNPLRDLELRAVDRRRERRPRENELQEILVAAKVCRNKYVYPLIKFALATGMRRGEILGLRKEHIDEDRRTIVIADSKNGLSRTIPLSHAASVILNTLPQFTDVVFPISANALRLNWERLMRRVGITNLRFHDLRHEAISRFYELGLTTPEVAMISGHRDPRMLSRYSHAAQSTALQKIDAA